MGVVIWYGRMPSSYDFGGIPVDGVIADEKRRVLLPLLMVARAAAAANLDE